MELLKLILYFNSFVWFLTPIRQFRTRFFYFFLVLALFDPAVILLHQFLIFRSLEIYLIGTVILIYTALIDFPTRTKSLVMLSFACISLVVVVYSLFDTILIQITIHMIIFIIFLRVLIIYFSENRKILWFHLILTVYEFSILLKFFVYYTRVDIGVEYFYATTALQILIGVFFIIMNEKNSPALKV